MAYHLGVYIWQKILSDHGFKKGVHETQARLSESGEGMDDVIFLKSLPYLFSTPCCIAYALASRG